MKFNVDALPEHIAIFAPVLVISLSKLTLLSKIDLPTAARVSSKSNTTRRYLPQLSVEYCTFQAFFFNPK